MMCRSRKLTLWLAAVRQSATSEGIRIRVARGSLSLAAKSEDQRLYAQVNLGLPRRDLEKTHGKRTFAPDLGRETATERRLAIIPGPRQSYSRKDGASYHDFADDPRIAPTLGPDCTRYSGRTSIPQ
jgi:hypothetical protein